MDSKRQQKYAKIIQKEISEIFQRDAKNLFNNAFITITDVKVSPDLSIAKIYLSPLLVNDRKAFLENVVSQTKKIRLLLGNKIRKEARIIPNLQFFLDENLEYAAKMDELFNKIEIPKDPDQESEQDKKKED